MCVLEINPRRSKTYQARRTLGVVGDIDRRAFLFGECGAWRSAVSKRVTNTIGEVAGDAMTYSRG